MMLNHSLFGEALKVHTSLTEVYLDGIALPVKMLKGTDPVETLDLSGKKLRSAHAVVIACLIGVNGALTALNLSSNHLEDEGVSAVCEAIQSNKVTKLASLNFERNGIGPVGANAVATMVAVTGALTKMSLARNMLGEEGTKAICEALKQNKTLKELDLSGYMVGNIGGAAGAKHVADMLGVNGALTKLWLADNNLQEEGIFAICEALEQNTTLKELNISGGRPGNNIGGSAGAKHVAKMVGVNGGLTSIDLSGNQLCGIWEDWRGQQGTYTAEGITAIADALRVNGALT
jgi:Ran GTPase-activating protein (RanGAP) involved in mRNA processing and transport